MTSTNFHFKKAIIIILSGGAILFLSVFGGIRIGHALKGGAKDSSATISESGRPAAGQPIPSLKLYAADGRPTNLREVVSGSAALVALTMPGCHSCSDVLSEWKRDGLVDGDNGARVIVVVATSPEDFDAGDLASFAQTYPMYFCDTPDLYFNLDIHGLPAVLGVTGEGVISCFTDDADSIRDTAYLRRHQ